MFVCEECNTQSQAGEKQFSRTMVKRRTEYINKNNVTFGFETVKEIKVCKDCSEE